MPRDITKSRRPFFMTSSRRHSKWRSCTYLVICLIQNTDNKAIWYKFTFRLTITIQWRHNERDGVSNRQPHDYLLNRLFRCKSKKTSKLRVTGLCARIHRWPVNSPQMASDAEHVSIWWRHHDLGSGRDEWRDQILAVTGLSLKTG